MKIIAGLGNPGPEYAGTPHNAGFASVDVLCRRLGCEWRFSSRFKADVAPALSSGGEKLLLMKPSTYMNASGEAVAAAMRYYKAEPSDVIVVCDDVNLPPSRIRIRPDGGFGGHRGLLSVGTCLGTGAFIRIRVGVGGGDRPGEDLTGFVLGKMPPETQSVMEDAYSRAADAALFAAERGSEAAMNRFNAFSPVRAPVSEAETE